MNLHLFNPDHDLALAHGTNHYMSPMSAVRFAEDVAALPAWIADGDYILTPHLPMESFQQMCAELGHHVQFVQLADLSELRIQKVSPWGWNDNIVKWLKKNGLQESILPTDEVLQTIRTLSHRRLTIRLAEYVRAHFSHPDLLPEAAAELTGMAAAERFVQERGAVVFKMPWSGSGRGLRRVFEAMDDHQYGWVRRSIQRYGCIMAEPYHSVVQDFAMEFFADSGGVHFVGYSLFNTHNGVYQENILLSDEQILKQLSSHVDRDLVQEIQQLVQEFVANEISPSYMGCIGVDMFLYSNDNQCFINPFVEVNLRTTMGFVAAQFVRKHLAPQGNGVMRMRYLPESGALLREHQQLSTAYPLHADGNRIVQGYLSLNPIDADTQYAVQIRIL